MRKTKTNYNQINLKSKDKHLKNILLVFFGVFLAVFIFCFLKIVDKIRKEKMDFEPAVVERNIELENKIKEITKGYPIAGMAKLIAQQDDQVAAFILAIAKKESNWGKRTPKLNGEECNNFWGFRQKRDRMGSGGHTCFDSQKDAVRSVAERIKELIASGIDTPEEMVVWKCGSSCDAHSSESVEKWIQDVKFYYDKF